MKIEKLWQMYTHNFNKIMHLVLAACIWSLLQSLYCHIVAPHIHPFKRIKCIRNWLYLNNLDSCASVCGVVWCFIKILILLIQFLNVNTDNLFIILKLNEVNSFGYCFFFFLCIFTYQFQMSS